MFNLSRVPVLTRRPHCVSFLLQRKDRHTRAPVLQIVVECQLIAVVQREPAEIEARYDRTKQSVTCLYDPNGGSSAAQLDKDTVAATELICEERYHASIVNRRMFRRDE